MAHVQMNEPGGAVVSATTVLGVSPTLRPFYLTFCLSFRAKGHVHCTKLLHCCVCLCMFLVEMKKNSINGVKMRKGKPH